MRKFSPRAVAIIVIGISFLIAYNSCQGPQTASPAQIKAASCRAMLERGKTIAVRSNGHPLFKAKKVRLQDPSNSGMMREVSNLVVKKRTKLSALVDNSCLAKTEAPSEFLKMVIGSASRFPVLDEQAYSFQLQYDLASTELDAEAAQEPCIIGISWEREYRLSSFSFNDPNASNQTHLNTIHAFDAYSLIFGSNPGLITKPVKVAVLDTGIDTTHPDLSANLWWNSGGPGIDITTIGGQVSYTPTDISAEGHGTHVSGIIAAVSNNNVGIIGTAPFGAQIMALKVFSNSGSGLTTSTTIFSNAIKAAYLNGASVINISIQITGNSYDYVAQTELQDAVNHGATVVVAMGNGDNHGQLVDGVSVHVVPAIFSGINGVIGVASMNANTGTLSVFSNYSTQFAEIAAPGALDDNTGIYSTLPTWMTTYGTLMGTSQATPMVSAAAALTIGWIEQAYGTPPSPAEVERLILTSAVKNSALSTYVKNGNQLDLLSLASYIQSQYPKVGSSGILDSTNPCGP